MSNIIAYTGTHGIGKTTAVYKKAHSLKLETKKSVGIILETARKCPFPVCTKYTTTTEQAQFWIFTKQMNLEIEESSYYDLIVSDRTVFDAIAYSFASGFERLASSMFIFAKEHINIYKEIIFKKLKDNDFCKDDNFRMQNKEFRQLVEDILLDIYQQANIKLRYE